MQDCAADDSYDNHETSTGDTLAANTMSEPIRKMYTCHWIKTEPVEENETSDVFHQFQSEPVDNSERKWDIKRESLTGVGLLCGQMRSGTTGSFEQKSQFTSPEMKFDPSTDVESDSSTSSDTQPAHFEDGHIKVKVENDSDTDPNEASTSFSVNLWQPDINKYLQTKEATDTNMTLTSVIHSDIKQFVCDMCNMSFKQETSLRIHKQTHGLYHSIQRPVCDVCNKSFSQKKYLTQHMKSHTGRIPYECDVCQKVFKHSCKLVRHMLTHTDIKPFVCDVCNKSFRQNIHLTQHKLIHTDQKPYVCDVCDKNFTRRSQLTQHMLSHSNDRQFVCDVCHKGFKQNGNLTRHKLTHADIK